MNDLVRTGQNNRWNLLLNIGRYRNLEKESSRIAEPKLIGGSVKENAKVTNHMEIFFPSSLTIPRGLFVWVAILFFFSCRQFLSLSLFHRWQAHISTLGSSDAPTSFYIYDPTVYSYITFCSQPNGVNNLSPRSTFLCHNGGNASSFTGTRRYAIFVAEAPFYAD